MQAIPWLDEERMLYARFYTPKLWLMWLSAFCGLLSIAIVWAGLRAATWLLCATVVGAVRIRGALRLAPRPVEDQPSHS